MQICKIYTLLIRQFSLPFIITGDYNVHHVSWGGNYNDARGKTISEFATKNNLLILNNTEPTYLHSNRKFTHIDLTLISNQIAHQYSWSTYHDLMDSNHYPILIKTMKDEPTKWNLR